MEGDSRFPPCFENSHRQIKISGGLKAMKRNAVDHIYSLLIKQAMTDKLRALLTQP
jgi:hypothetical protein